MRRIRFFIDLGLGQTKAEHFNFPEDASNEFIQRKFTEWVSDLNQGWEELFDAPSQYVEEPNKDLEGDQ
jgi:hypothetical protein